VTRSRWPHGRSVDRAGRPKLRVSESCLARCLKIADREDGLSGGASGDRRRRCRGDLEAENRDHPKRTKQLEQETRSCAGVGDCQLSDRIGLGSGAASALVQGARRGRTPERNDRGSLIASGLQSAARRAIGTMRQPALPSNCTRDVPAHLHRCGLHLGSLCSRAVCEEVVTTHWGGVVAMVQDDGELRSIHSEQWRYYEETASQPDQALPQSVERALLDALLAPSQAGRAGHAVDMGCGTGRWTALLTEHYSSVTGVDYSPDRLRRAASRLPGRTGDRAALICADVLSFTPDEGVDVLLAAFLLSHVQGSAVSPLVARWLRVLAPEGHLVLVDHGPEAYQENAWAVTDAVAVRRLPQGDALRVIKRFGVIDEVLCGLPPGWVVHRRMDSRGYILAVVGRG
jgi:ubiquinone/menaquinone biosynthesis C-methylase UbiE